MPLTLSSSAATMFWSRASMLSALAGIAAAQFYEGYELDEPMLRGPRRTGSSAMLRFGCSQVVIERLDP
jgi:hypothetical protein